MVRLGENLRLNFDDIIDLLHSARRTTRYHVNGNEVCTHLSTSEAQDDVEVMRGNAPGPDGAENAELGDRLE